TFGHDVGVAHVGVDVHAFIGLQDDGVVELGVHFHAPFQDVDVFLAGMAYEAAELFDAPGAHPGEHRDHALVAQFGAQIVVVVIGGGDANGVLDAADAAARGDRRFGRV